MLVLMILEMMADIPSLRLDDFSRADFELGWKVLICMRCRLFCDFVR